MVHVVRTSYRILMMSPELFSRLWNWSCFLDLSEYSKSSLDIRWCTLQILSIVFNLGDTMTMKSGIGDEDAFECLLRLVHLFLKK